MYIKSVFRIHGRLPGIEFLETPGRVIIKLSTIKPVIILNQRI
jgi:hypothetical protein